MKKIKNIFGWSAIAVWSLLTLLGIFFNGYSFWCALTGRGSEASDIAFLMVIWNFVTLLAPQVVVTLMRARRPRLHKFSQAGGVLYTLGLLLLNFGAIASCETGDYGLFAPTILYACLLQYGSLATTIFGPRLAYAKAESLSR